MNLKQLRKIYYKNLIMKEMVKKKEKSLISNAPKREEEVKKQNDNTYELDKSKENFEKRIEPFLEEIENAHLAIGDYSKKYNINEIGISKYIYKILKYSLIISNKKLEKEFSKDEDLELFFHYLIWHYYFCKNPKKNVNQFAQFINYMNKKKEEIFMDKNLKNYQKAKLLSFYSNGLEKHSKYMKKYYDSIIGYYFFDDMNEDSILIKTLNVIKYISANITEKSGLFFPLLLINSGIGLYKNEKTYCFKALSPKMISKHLEDLTPEIFVLYSNPEDDIYGETEKCHGILTINIDNMYKNIDEDSINFLFSPMDKAPNFLDSTDLLILLFYLSMKYMDTIN